MWTPIEQCLPLLEHSKYSRFNQDGKAGEATENEISVICLPVSNISESSAVEAAWKSYLERMKSVQFTTPALNGEFYLLSDACFKYILPCRLKVVQN